MCYCVTMLLTACVELTASHSSFLTYKISEVLVLRNITSRLPRGREKQSNKLPFPMSPMRAVCGAPRGMECETLGSSYVKLLAWQLYEWSDNWLLSATARLTWLAGLTVSDGFTKFDRLRRGGEGLLLTDDPDIVNIRLVDNGNDTDYDVYHLPRASWFLTRVVSGASWLNTRHIAKCGLATV